MPILFINASLIARLGHGGELLPLNVRFFRGVKYYHV